MSAVPAKLSGRLGLVFKLTLKNLLKFIPLLLLLLVPIFILMGVIIAAAPKEPDPVPYAVLIAVTVFLLIMIAVKALIVGTSMEAAETMLETGKFNLTKAFTYGWKNFAIFLRTLLRVGWYVSWLPLLVLLLSTAISIGIFMKNVDVVALKDSIDLMGPLALAELAGNQAVAVAGGIFMLGFILSIGIAIKRSIIAALAYPVVKYQKVKTGGEVLDACIKITQGKWWGIFGNLFVFWAVSTAPFLALSLWLEAAFGETGVAVSGILNLGFAVFAIPFYALTTVVIYLHFKK